MTTTQAIFILFSISRISFKFMTREHIVREICSIVSQSLVTMDIIHPTSINFDAKAREQILSRTQLEQRQVSYQGTSVGNIL